MEETILGFGGGCRGRWRVEGKVPNKTLGFVVRVIWFRSRLNSTPKLRSDQRCIYMSILYLCMMPGKGVDYLLHSRGALTVL